MVNWGEAYLDHYERFFGAPESGQKFSLDVSHRLVQILGYQGVVGGCSAYCSLGLTHFESAVGGIAELCAIVDGFDEQVPRLVANAVFFMAERRMTVGWGMAVGGIDVVDPAFVAATGKEALYVTSAEGRTPEGFEVVRCGTQTGNMYLAVFLSKNEYAYFKKHGAEELERRMAEAKSDPFALTRPSIL